MVKGRGGRELGLGRKRVSRRRRREAQLRVRMITFMSRGIVGIWVFMLMLVVPFLLALTWRWWEFV